MLSFDCSKNPFVTDLACSKYTLSVMGGGRSITVNNVSSEGWVPPTHLFARIDLWFIGILYGSLTRASHTEQVWMGEQPFSIIQILPELNRPPHTLAPDTCILPVTLPGDQPTPASLTLSHPRKLAIFISSKSLSRASNERKGWLTELLVRSCQWRHTRWSWRLVRGTRCLLERSSSPNCAWFVLKMVSSRQL